MSVGVAEHYTLGFVSGSGPAVTVCQHGGGSLSAGSGGVFHLADNPGACLRGAGRSWNRAGWRNHCAMTPCAVNGALAIFSAALGLTTYARIAYTLDQQEQW